MRNNNDRTGKSPFNIETLIDDLTPVRPLRVRNGVLLAVAVMVVLTIIVAMTINVRADLAAGSPAPMFFVRASTLVLLGISACYAVMSSARPEIGKESRFKLWKSLAGVALMFPVVALVHIAGDIPSTTAEVNSLFSPSVGRECLTVGGICALIVGAVMVLWLRKGAVVSQKRAGFLTGLAAGAMGAAAYSIHCPMNSVVYIGTWFTAVVVISALIGWLVVPRLLRW